MLRDVALFAQKDLRIEYRSKVAIGQILPFAFTTLILFGFALEPDSGVLQRAAAGLFWITILFSSTLAIQRSFSFEPTDALRLSPVSPVAIFYGKACALALQLLLLELLLGFGVVVLYGITINASLLLVSTCIVATIGIATSGTLYGALAASSRGKETLLPLLFLPVIAPVLLAATRATEAALNGLAFDGLPWLKVLVAFTVIYAAVGSLVFSSLLEDS